MPVATPTWSSWTIFSGWIFFRPRIGATSGASTAAFSISPAAIFRATFRPSFPSSRSS